MKLKRRSTSSKERDLSILKDYNDGMSIVRMVAKWNITSSRIYQILNKYGSKNE